MHLLKLKTKSTRKYISKLLNLTDEYASIYDSYDLMDALVSHEYNGAEIPFDLPEKVKSDLELIYDVDSFFGFFGSPLAQAIGAAKLLEEIVMYFENFKGKANEYKFVMISAHDVNIIALLNSLEISHPSCRLHFNKDQCYTFPLFASQMLFELITYDDESKFFIRIIYNGEKVKEIEYSDLMALIESKLPSDYESICKGTKLSMMN